jgi:hypothetical protein
LVYRLLVSGICHVTSGFALREGEGLDEAISRLDSPDTLGFERAPSNTKCPGVDLAREVLRREEKFSRRVGRLTAISLAESRNLQPVSDRALDLLDKVKLLEEVTPEGQISLPRVLREF